MKKIITSVLLTLALTISAAQARMAYYTSEYLVRVHFDSTFYGTPVTSVMAHVGVVSGRSWPVTADIELQRQNNGFFAKTRIPYQFQSGYGEPNGLSVTYLVRLADGRQVWTDTAWIPVIEQHKYYEGCHERQSDCLYPGAGQDLFDAFNSCSGAERTYATRFVTYH